MIMDLQTRSTNSSKAQLKGNRLEGYAAIFNSPTTITEGKRTFTEVIRPNAFRELPQDIKFTYNHNLPILGRTLSGTLEVRQDDTGLFYSLLIPDTTVGRDVKVMLERGDLFGSSFTFFPVKSRFDHETNIQELLDIRCVECAVVDSPAYKSTSAYLRSVEQEQEQNDLWKLQLKLLRQQLDIE